MERKEVFSGKTVEEAIETGLKELGVTRDEVQIETVEEGKKKLFKSVPAQVVITVKDNRTDGERAVCFLKGLFEKLGYEVEPLLRGEEEKIEIELGAESTKGLIGR
nr:Jag N-terminal domain-containing protein [Clostridiales bacterium]